MYGNVSDADTRAAMRTLQDMGIATVKIEFSGGNDEGGADGFDYLDAEGKSEGLPSHASAYRDQRWDPATKSYGPVTWVVSTMTDGKWGTRPATEDEVKVAELVQVLESPIYDRYGSFAGEFHVYGTVTWDVASGKHEMHGSESHEVYEDF